MDVHDYRGWWPPEWPDWPDNPKARQVVEGLYEIGLFILNADASRRKSRMENATRQVQVQLSRMTGEEQLDAQDLATVWEKNALFQLRIRWQEKKDGFEAVKHLRSQWRTAAYEMKKAEAAAANLGVPTHEYLMRRVEVFHILQEEKDEFGEYHGYPDFSELQEQWYSRKPITARLPWAWENMLQVCKRYESRKGTSTGQRKSTTLERTKPFIGWILTIAGIIVTVAFAMKWLG